MMIKIIFNFSLLLLMVSCNSEKKPSDKTTAEDHSLHQMIGGSNSYADSVNSGLIAEDTLKGSPHRTAMNTINGTHVHIEYSSPGVKGRVIWGGLVAYDKVWVTGAHAATTIRFYKPVEIEGKTIPAGTYALFSIPGKETWQVILNSHYNQHLADEYNEKDDILRFSVKPENDTMMQRLTYSVDASGENSGSVIMRWEKIKIIIPFKAK